MTAAGIVLPKTKKQMKQKKKARPRGRLEHQLYPRYLTLPAFILFTVFFILPILGGVGISLTNWTVSRPSITRFVGLKNYITMFQDDDILLAFKNTAIFTVAIVILRNLFAILLALALVKKLYTRTYLRTIFYIPAVLSYVVVGIMFTAMFQMNGTFNQILNAFGIPCTKEWLASGDTALLMVIVEDVWKWTGFHMIIYIAGLQAIPTDLYEAAKIDGANDMQIFVRVMLPLLTAQIATFTLFTAVGYWNEWFWSMLVINSSQKMTLMSYLRAIVMEASGVIDSDSAAGQDLQNFSMGVKMASVVLTMLPIMFVYPFLQKYFAKGILVGAVKM